MVQLNDVQLRYRAKQGGGSAHKLLESEGGYSVVVGESKERSCGLFNEDKVGAPVVAAFC